MNSETGTMTVEKGYKVTEVGVIPEEWEVWTIGELSDFVGSGITPRGGQSVYKTSGIPFIRSQNVFPSGLKLDDIVFIGKEQHQNMKRTEVCSNDVLLNITGASIGRCTMVPQSFDRGNVNQHVCIIRSNGRIHSNYLSQYLNSKKGQDQIVASNTGSSRQGLNFQQVRKIKILLPPLPEQEKIAEILSTVDEHIGETEELIDKTETLKQGMMQRLLTQGIGHTEFKDTEIAPIPIGWEIKQLDTVKSENPYSMAGGPFGSDLKVEDYCSNGIRVIQLQNIREGKFYDDYKIYTSIRKADQLIKCNIYPGDIIIAKMADPVARACIIPRNEDRYLMASDGIRLAVNTKLYDTKFLVYSINFNRFRKLAEQNSTGTTRLRIGLETLRRLPIVLPPLPEQRQIADILTTIDDRIDDYKSKQESLNQLKRGLMQQLLTGKIRVKV